MSTQPIGYVVRIDDPDMDGTPIWQPCPTDYTEDEARERADYCRRRYPRARVRLYAPDGRPVYESPMVLLDGGREVTP